VTAHILPGLEKAKVRPKSSLLSIKVSQRKRNVTAVLRERNKRLQMVTKVIIHAFGPSVKCFQYFRQFFLGNGRKRTICCGKKKVTKPNRRKRNCNNSAKRGNKKREAPKGFPCKKF
jgi:hypothetical protein